MFLKYKHPKIDDHSLYYLKTDNYQTTPVDLTSFILDRIDKNKDISEFIKNFETLGVENDIPSYFQNYMSIADVELTSRVLAPIAHKIETYIKGCKNFDLESFNNELIIYINQLNEVEIVDALFANRLIWNYLNDENKMIDNVQSYEHFDLKQLSDNIDFEFKKIIDKAANLNMAINPKNLTKLKIKNKVDFYIVENNEVYLEIDHEIKTVWINKEGWDFICGFWKDNLDCDYNDVINKFFPLYFFSDEKIFKPIWFKAMGYTVKAAGEYAKIYWKIIEKQIN